MYKTLLEQYESAFGIESKQTRRKKYLSKRIQQYNICKEIFGKKRAKKLIIEATFQNKL